MDGYVIWVVGTSMKMHALEVVHEVTTERSEHGKFASFVGMYVTLANIKDVLQRIL
jgi:hypothetical protein